MGRFLISAFESEWFTNRSGKGKHGYLWGGGLCPFNSLKVRLECAVLSVLSNHPQKQERWSP